MTPREVAQKQAEEAMDGFIFWSKKAALWSALFLCVVALFVIGGGIRVVFVVSAVYIIIVVMLAIVTNL